MFKKLLIGAAASTLVAGSALAADIEAPPAAYDWTGFYIGAQGGYLWGGSATKLSGTDSSDSGLGSILAAGYLVDPVDPPDGYLLGGQIGYNYQVDQIVLGAEADLAYVDADDSNSKIVGGGLKSGTRRDMDYFGTLRARLGFVPTERLLVYATGGLAFGDSEATFYAKYPLAEPPLAATASDKAEVGWTVGGGAEFAVGDRWTIKAEYIYYDLGNTSSTVSYDYQNKNQDQTSTLTGKTRHDGNIVRIGLNFRL